MERKSALVLVMILVLLAGCSHEAEQPSHTTTTILISGPEEEPREPIVARGFAVTPAAVRVGGTATAAAELDAAHPDRTISVDWFGPDGWLIAYSVQVAERPHLTFAAPRDAFREPGRYRAVLRSGRRMLRQVFVSVGT